MSMMNKAIGQVIVVDGPSGVGKTSILDIVTRIDPTINRIVTHTTRDPRPGEVNGKDYYFVSDTEFDNIVCDNGFAEQAYVYGRRYGISKKEINQNIIRGNDVVINVDINGVRRVKSIWPHAISVFILPPSTEALLQRLQKRDPNNYLDRLVAVPKDIKHIKEYDYVLINDHLNATAIDFIYILRTIKMKSKVMTYTYKGLIEELKDIERLSTTLTKEN